MLLHLVPQFNEGHAFFKLSECVAVDRGNTVGEKKNENRWRGERGEGSWEINEDF